MVGAVADVRKTISGELLPDVYVPFEQILVPQRGATRLDPAEALCEG